MQHHDSTAEKAFTSPTTDWTNVSQGRVMALTIHADGSAHDRISGKRLPSGTFTPSPKAALQAFLKGKPLI